MGILPLKRFDEDAGHVRHVPGALFTALISAWVATCRSPVHCAAWEECDVTAGCTIASEQKFVVIEGETENFVLAEEHWGDCRSLEGLWIKAPMYISPSIFSKCKALSAIQFQGPNYPCEGTNWREVIKEAKLHNVLLRARDSSCGNSSKFPEVSGDFLRQIVYAESRDECVAGCECVVFLDDIYQYSLGVNCSHRSFNDSNLPNHLPFWSTHIFFDDNYLQDVEPWLNRTLPSTFFIDRIHLQSNQIQKLPILPQTKNKLRFMFLDNNNMTKLDSVAFASYLRYKDFSVGLKANAWRCNCQMETFVIMMQENLNIFNDYSRIICRNEKGENLRPWMYDFSECHDEAVKVNVVEFFFSYLDLIILGLVNLSLVVMLIDIQLVLRKGPSSNGGKRTPLMVHLVLAFEQRILNPYRNWRDRVDPAYDFTY